jgi:hypothetical protein
MPVGVSTTCITHPDRPVLTRVCVAALRDGLDPAQNICSCCDVCAAHCLTVPHSCGGTPLEEFDETTARCKVCGQDITLWLPLSRWR